MNLLDILHGMDILGWTLLHSLWQGLVIGFLFLWIRRVLPSASPSLKYAISTGALLLMLFAAVATFIYLVPDTMFQALEKTGSTERTTIDSIAFLSTSWNIDPAALLQALTRWINDHIPALISGWLMGILFFGFRLVITWTQTLRLRKGAMALAGFWEERLRELALDLGISKTILLAQSDGVDAPVLLGYLKPVILLPVGMMSGLSPDQVETILLHELAHIGRHDFAINFLQSMVEVIFFFNPIVWIISSHIRSDRELCCDDVVVTMKSPLTYARALHQLAEVKTFGNSFSLGVAGNKNKLLQRIKRIMKTSEKKDENRGKVIPAVIVMMALAVASWLSIQAYHPDRNGEPSQSINSQKLPADTVKKDLQDKRSGTYSRQSVTTYDEKDQPHTEVIEHSEGDAEIELFGMAADVDIEMPPMPVIAPIAEFPAIAELNFNLDTLPGSGWQVVPDRKEWEKEFTDKFRERFSDFYEKNRPEFDKMMRELDANLQQIHFGADQKLAMALDRKMQSELGRVQAELQRLAPLQGEMMRAQELSMDKMNQDMHRNQELLELTMKAEEEHMKGIERHMKAFEKELMEQLVKDGYLGKDEKLNTIDWNDGDGTLKINGKKIKATDEQKYKDLHRKFLKERSHIGLAE